MISKAAAAPGDPRFIRNDPKRRPHTLNPGRRHGNQDRSQSAGESLWGGAGQPSVSSLMKATPSSPGSSTYEWLGQAKKAEPDETLFAAIIYVPFSGCVWRQLPPCFGISMSTRRLTIGSSYVSRAGGLGCLRETVLHRLDEAGLIPVPRVVLDAAHVKAQWGAHTQVRPRGLTGGKPGSKIHIAWDANELPLAVGVSARTSKARDDRVEASSGCSAAGMAVGVW
jgi:hypothetical protein